MRFRVAVLILLAMAFGMAALSARAADAPDLSKAKCPVVGGGVKADFNAPFEGGTVYFCCNNCKAKFQADPAKYAAKARAQLVATGQAKQTACPLMAKPVKAAYSANVGGNEVGLCCSGCVKKLKAASEDEQIELIYGQAFGKGFAIAARSGDTASAESASKE